MLFELRNIPIFGAMRILLLFFLFVFAFQAYGQEPDYIQYTTTDGLYSNTVFKIKQTKDNQMWIVSNGGATRFDGSDFYNYTERKGLRYGSVIEIYEDDEGPVVFLDVLGVLFKYNALKDSIEVKTIHTDESEKLNKGAFCSFVKDKENTYHLGYVNGEGGVTVDKNGDVSFHADTSSCAIQVRTINGQLLFYTTHQPGNKIQFNGVESTCQVSTLQRSPHLNAILLNETYSVLTYNKTLMLFKENKLVLEKNFNTTLIALDLENDSTFWIGSYNNGCERLKLSGDSIVSTGHFHGKRSVTSVILDHEGAYWFSTLSNGLYYTPNLYSSSWQDYEGTPLRGITAIEGNSENEIIVGMNNGSIAIFRNDTLCQILALSPGEDQNTFRRVDNIHYDKTRDCYWISATRLYCYSEGKITVQEEFYKHIGERRIRVSYADDAGNIWFGGNGFLSRRSSNGTFGNVIAADVINQISHGINGELLVSNRFKLSQLSADSTELELVELPNVKHIYNLKSLDDTLLICLNKGGILSITENDTVLNGYDGNFSRTMNYDAALYKEHIWSSTSRGVEKLDLKSPSTPNYYFGLEHGLTSLNLGYLYIQEDKVWVTCASSLYMFPIEHLHPQTPPSPTIQKVQTELRTYTFLDTTLLVPYEENDLIFHFKTITFKHKDNHSFEYRLLPETEEFQSIESNQLSFSGLSNGEYTFEIRTLTDNGLISDSTLLHFTIQTPYWKSWWFIIGIALVSFLFFYWTMKTIIRKVRAKEREKAATLALIQSLKLEALHSQFNPHFTFNAMNSIQQYMTPTNLPKAKEYLGMFAGVMRSVLNNSQKESIPLAIEIETLVRYLELEKLRFGDRLTYDITYDDGVDPDYDKVPPMLFQPILENAINYGIFNKPGGGHLDIRFGMQDDLLSVTIVDNGIGRAAVQHIQKVKKNLSTGKGIQLVIDRLHLFNASERNDFVIEDLHNEEGEATGTKVTLKLEMRE